MKIGIIADDLTGANDSGVQLTRSGLNTSVRFDLKNANVQQDDAIVLDTDSRSISPEKAYTRVVEAAQFLKEEKIDIIYKKIDSTLRGNLGVELDAVYDVFKPDFVVMAPGYPVNGRTVMDGKHYLHGTLLHETEISRDPKCPVTESYIPKLLQDQTKRNIGHISTTLLAEGYNTVKAALDEYKNAGTAYVLFDSATEHDLELIAQYIKQSRFSVVWLGSAGLANYLPQVYHLEKEKQTVTIPHSNKPVLLVVGSVTSVSRKQLDHFLAQKGVQGIGIDSTELVSTVERRSKELELGFREAVKAYKEGHHVAIYSTGDREAIRQAQEEGAKQGLSHTDVSNAVVAGVGKIVSELLEETELQGIIMTGGDTAKQICDQIGVTGIHLIDEVETGVPIGQLIGRYPIYAVTKAGAFGSEATFTLSKERIQGGNQL
ncbi:four-carbon acid sugar kinase family protein [Bacillus horti]|uniref:Uncharacterized protein YgbK (DUF1537 family) n=1 Tax=Caldalkalibacillus horti TaxID=77523 RepID=A0ABT9W634_9BACI|nr:four-carbon acid sugar kinase family protein [Bacillus horti]MDQ0168542.1 uncharacterized protein YgbK (DUF1537 family) [Bacillus horti]